jgi:luciferase family oxidoreductase group 1
MVPFSVLDLAPIVEGGNAHRALTNTVDLARHAEKLGYQRYWLAEHHNMAGVASAATSVVLAYVGTGTSTIRIGAGGIMLPNHAPLIIAEQFGTLDALFPGRIDLGLGRAPGTDQVTARALRRALDASSFPEDVLELMNYFSASGSESPVQAVPGRGANVSIWILGSSLFGAQLAAALGLPFAFASHFAPALMMQAAEVYQSQFKPSAQLSKPHLMLGVNVVAADTDAEAQLLATSLQQMFIQLRRGRPGPVPAPRADFERTLAAHERAMLEEVLSCSFVGSSETVRRGLSKFVSRTGAHELILSTMLYDHAARLRSYEIAAQVRAAL